MRKTTLITTILVVLCCVLVSTSNAQSTSSTGGVGMRFGAGTDVNGGAAFGAEINILKPQENNGIELAFAVFYGKFEEDTKEPINSYHEETEITVIGVMANYLLEFEPVKSPYFVFGVGAGVIIVNWSESSETDQSLGTPFGASGSIQEEDASAGGTIFNLGVGYRFSEKVDLRAQVPTFIILGAPGEASSVVPTLSITLGIRL